MMANIPDCFNVNMFSLRIFGLWSGESYGKFYKYYSSIYLFITVPVYMTLLTLSLIYTPRKIDLIIRELLLYVFELAMVSKVYMMLVKRNRIVDVFAIIDCDSFKGEDDISREIMVKYLTAYKIYWKFYFLISNFCYCSKLLVPVLSHFIFETPYEFPVCNFYFLDKNNKERYFIYWYLYQAIGCYGHLTYNVNVDTFIIGLVVIAVAQVDIIHYELSEQVTSVNESANDNREKLLLENLNHYLKHYELLLTYTSTVQDIISITIFVMFSMTSACLCAIMCNIYLSPTMGSFVVLAPYLFAVMLQVFVPSYLGTQLSYKSQELVNAAYFSKWIPASESFKRSLQVFMQRAHTSILLTGCGLIPLTLGTFTSIMKSAYSFFALVRTIQDRE